MASSTAMAMATLTHRPLGAAGGVVWFIAMGSPPLSLPQPVPGGHPREPALLAWSGPYRAPPTSRYARHEHGGPRPRVPPGRSVRRRRRRSPRGHGPGRRPPDGPYGRDSSGAGGLVPRGVRGRRGARTGASRTPPRPAPLGPSPPLGRLGRPEPDRGGRSGRPREDLVSRWHRPVLGLHPADRSG